MAAKLRARHWLIVVLAVSAGGCGTTQSKLYFEANNFLNLPEQRFIVGETDFDPDLFPVREFDINLQDYIDGVHII